MRGSRGRREGRIGCLGVRGAPHFAALLVGLGTVGCGGGDGGSLGPSPTVEERLGPTARALVEEIATELLRDARWVAGHSHAEGEGFPELGFAASLPAVDRGSRGIVTLVADAEPGSFEPFCDSDAGDDGAPESAFWAERDRCLRLTKEAERSWVAELYFTREPRRAPDDRHPFAYPVSGLGPDATVEFDPNPLIGWRVSLRPDGSSAVTAAPDARVALRAGDETLDLSHTGQILAFHQDPEEPVDRLELAFGSLHPAGPVSLTLRVENESPFGADGGVRVGETTLATVTGFAGALLFTWR